MHVAIVDSDRDRAKGLVPFLTGLEVTVHTEYRYPFLLPTDLIILGCSSVGTAEIAYIKRVSVEKKVIVIVNIPDFHSARAAFLAGAIDIVVQPAGLPTLREIVEKCLKR